MKFCPMARTLPTTPDRPPLYPTATGKSSILDTFWRMSRASRNPLVLLAVVLQVAAAACIGVAFSKRDAATSVEGAYFNRSVGSDEVAVAWGSDVGPWLVAAGALLVAGLASWLLTALRASR
jgi:hypothetical protein